MPAALARALAYSDPFADELAKLMRENPTPDPRRWEQAKQDAVEFLTDWGERAAELGWTAGELFGLHPVATLTRYDVMGLVWLLNGKEYAAFDDAVAQALPLLREELGADFSVRYDRLGEYEAAPSSQPCKPSEM